MTSFLCRQTSGTPGSAVVIKGMLIIMLSWPIRVACQSSLAAEPASAAAQVSSDRDYWLTQLDRLARPVLSNLAHDSLRLMMPVVLSPITDDAVSRKEAAYLEAFGRLLSGMAPWLGSEGGSAREIALRSQYRQWALQSIAHAVDPHAADHMSWGPPGQALVDAAYFAFAFLRCPWLWEHLPDRTRSQVVLALQQTRKIKPVFSNWLLFSGMIEAFFCKFGLPWDEMRVDYCIRQMDEWYAGDGVYSDGPAYHWDYYNSYVIHPFLAAIVSVVDEKKDTYKNLEAAFEARSERYAIIQERLIGPDGSYPLTGRSITYRGAAFHHLADMAWRKKLPAPLSPAQVRCALTAVIKRTMEAPGTYTATGWLNIGLAGSQPGLADFYITTGSQYICANIFLPLGLPATDPFWTAPPAPWTAQKIWSGHNDQADHSIN